MSFIDRFKPRPLSQEEKDARDDHLQEIVEGIVHESERQQGEKEHKNAHKITHGDRLARIAVELESKANEGSLVGTRKWIRDCGYDCPTPALRVYWTDNGSANYRWEKRDT